MPSTRLPQILRVVALILLVSAARRAGADALGLGYRDWRPVDPKEASLQQPAVEKDADAEIVFWEVHAFDEFSGRAYSIQDHYVRLKIFTKHGAEEHSQIELPFDSKHFISDVRGRTVKPDGTIAELKSEDVHERTVVKTGRHQVKVKAFTLPAVEPGVVVEYQWRQRGDGLFINVRYPLQRDMPARELRYFIKPLIREWMPYKMSVAAFHTELPKWDATHDDFHTITLRNVPAFHAEPHMPPENEVRPSMLVYYSSNPSTKADKYWKDYGKELYDWYKSSLTPNDEVQSAARRIIGSEAAPAAKLRLLYEYCRTELHKTEEYDTPLHEEQITEDRKQHQANGRTLSDKKGSNRDINVLFASLATAAGFTARMAAAADREDVFLDENFLNDHLLTEHIVAVRDGAQWRFYDPASARVPAGMLDWRNEGLRLLVGDPATTGFVDSPLSGPDKSHAQRHGAFKLAEDGTLSGDVRIEQTGHTAASTRAEYEEMNDAARLEKLRADLARTFPAAEITEVHVDNVDDVDKPLAVAYHLRVPGYAQRTGKRLIVQPALFEHGEPALLAGSTRLNPIYFHYPWSEQDRVTIELPAGYELDQPQPPSSISGGATADYKVKLLLSRNPTTLIYERSFTFGGDGSLLYEKASYPVLKQLFDTVHQQDGFSVPLKQAGL
jgi:hypothetical protein